MAEHKWYTKCPNCFGTGTIGNTKIFGEWHYCQACHGEGVVEVIHNPNRTNFDKILEDNKEFLKDLIKRDCCVDPQSHKIMRCQPVSQCKYCMFGKDKGDRFECNAEALEKWLDEEVKE